jgi:NADP-dependent aldehyde dehydrogenase
MTRPRDSSTAAAPTPDPVDRAVAASLHGLQYLRNADIGTRTHLLTSLADAIDAQGDHLIDLASAETHLSPDRLTGELARTSRQFRFYAQVAEDGAPFAVTTDHAGPGLDCDLRAMRVPLGPVAVFSAGNFPFAFGVLGTDTASALAAGCPVVVKAHPGHPRLSRALAELAADTFEALGAPPGMLGLVDGFDAGPRLVQHADVRAVAFTGSLAGGRALFDLAVARPDPIPFYGELGSLNPVFVLPGAALARRPEIAQGFVASFTGSAGQLCTKPGVLFVPRTARIGEDLRAPLAAVAGHRLLNEAIEGRFAQRLAAISAAPDVNLLGGDNEPPAHEGTTGPRPTLLVTTIAGFLESLEVLGEECFGPASLLVEYDRTDELVEAARRLPGQLTAAVHAEADEHETARALVDELVDRVGRLVWNGWPTGLPVARATHHGGPYPAATVPGATSVGARALDRFLRPVCFQNVPTDLLPGPLATDT